MYQSDKGKARQRFFQGMTLYRHNKPQPDSTTHYPELCGWFAEQQIKESEEPRVEYREECLELMYLQLGFID